MGSECRKRRRPRSGSPSPRPRPSEAGADELAGATGSPPEATGRTPSRRRARESDLGDSMSSLLSLDLDSIARLPMAPEGDIMGPYGDMERWEETKEDESANTRKNTLLSEYNTLSPEDFHDKVMERMTPEGVHKFTSWFCRGISHDIDGPEMLFDKIFGRCKRCPSHTIDYLIALLKLTAVDDGNDTEHQGCAEQYPGLYSLLEPSESSPQAFRAQVMRDLSQGDIDKLLLFCKNISQVHKEDRKDVLFDKIFDRFENDRAAMVNYLIANYPAFYKNDVPVHVLIKRRLRDLFSRELSPKDFRDEVMARMGPEGADEFTLWFCNILSHDIDGSDMLFDKMFDRFKNDRKGMIDNLIALLKLTAGDGLDIARGDGDGGHQKECCSYLYSLSEQQSLLRKDKISTKHFRAKVMRGLSEKEIEEIDKLLLYCKRIDKEAMSKYLVDIQSYVGGESHDRDDKDNDSVPY